MEEPGVSKLVAVNLRGGGGKVGRAQVIAGPSAAPLQSRTPFHDQQPGQADSRRLTR